MLSKRKLKQRSIHRWNYLWPDPEYDNIRGGVWRRRRLCTAYVDDERNYIYSNYSQYKELEGHYQDLWDEYYAGRL